MAKIPFHSIFIYSKLFVMKPITKLLLILTFLIATSITVKAQDPTFTVNWNSYCEVQSHDSYYKVTWAFIYIPTSTPIVQGFSENLGLNLLSWSKSITNWDCNIDDYPLKYRLVVKVERYQDDDETITCSGEARSSELRCSDLYNGVTLTVNMTYP